jgi:hypothetical protein
MGVNLPPPHPGTLSVQCKGYVDFLYQKYQESKQRLAKLQEGQGGPQPPAAAAAANFMRQPGA